tara:strand:+ start:357 stop:707 length:351 start_codon:yes stop_codon:yes gene_type:complete
LKVFFDRPTKKELMDVLHHFFLNEIDYENLQEINIFKLRIALNIFKILKREIRYEKELIKKLEDLSLKLFKQKIPSKNDLTKIIKNESFESVPMEDFLFELAKEKLLIDNPAYLKD